MTTDHELYQNALYREIDRLREQRDRLEAVVRDLLRDLTIRRRGDGCSPLDTRSMAAGRAELVAVCGPERGTVAATRPRRLPFPSDYGEMTVEVFYQKGDPAFVCGAHGSITGGMIEDLEKDFADNPDEGFSSGDGIYLYVPRWQSPQVDGEGRIELPGYWDLEEVGFKTLEQAMTELGTGKA